MAEPTHRAFRRVRLWSIPVWVGAAAIACAEDRAYHEDETAAGADGETAGTGAAGGGGRAGGGAGVGAGGTSAGTKPSEGGEAGDVPARGGAAGADMGGAAGDVCGPCSANHANAACVDGACVIQSCVKGFSDCNGKYADGCEAADVAVPESPRLVGPVRGAYSGSLHAAKSGTLRPTFTWSEVTTSCGAVRYELEVDDSCAAGALDACAFGSPELHTETGALTYTTATDLAVSKVAPVGAAYAWRVRACDAGACSPWSSVGYVNVGRTLHDVNGDGYADVVAANATSSDAALDLLLGKAQFDAVYDGRLSERLYYPRFAGDLNADGFADLAGTVDAILSCGPGQTGYAVRVIFGGATPQAMVVEDLCRTAGTSSVMMYPSGVGDLNGDGFDDLGVARGFGGQNDFVVYGGGTAVSTSPLTDIAGGDASYAFTRTYPQFAGGADFDGDSYADVVVGEGTTGAAKLHLLRGGAELGTDFSDTVDHPECTTLYAITPAAPGADAAHAGFGVLCGSANGNHFDLLPPGPGLALQTGLATTLPVAMASTALDFDDDGKMEWFITTSSSDGPIVWDGQPGSGGDQRGPLRGATHLVQTADQDGDGRPDLTFLNDGGSPVWLGSAKSFNVSPLYIQPPSDVTSAGPIAY